MVVVVVVVGVKTRGSGRKLRLFTTIITLLAGRQFVNLNDLNRTVWEC